jgi:NTP pyrophosphatase (non-canonical NTP hydrolase)
MEIELIQQKFSPQEHTEMKSVDALEQLSQDLEPKTKDPLEPTLEIRSLIERLANSTFNAYYHRVMLFNYKGGNQLGKYSLTKEEISQEMAMLNEEFLELIKAFGQQKKVKENGETTWVPCEPEEARVEIADAIGDIIYILLGTSAKLGIDIGLVLDEIATSNETKYNDKGDLVRIDGKIQKGPNFKTPDLSFTKTPVDFESFLKEDRKE